ncbi:hypothetical protein [Selenomonas noxia]|jgi:hypothetical protein|uniref:hypothetical protein n=1 Tax=Selenomonas noxia TaxID=135083 RepID=UPI0028D24E0B|nr:hypothetical protein [Selenomonas noxia]
MQNCIFKFYRVLLAAVLILGSAAQVSAGGAPPLTRIAPIELCAEETGCIPAPEDYPNRLPEDIVFRGEHLIVRTRFIGSPAWSTVTYRNGTETGPTLGCTELARTPLTDGTRTIIGYEQVVMIPLDQPGTEAFDLCITAADASSGAPQCACIRGIRTEKRG